MKKNFVIFFPTETKVSRAYEGLSESIEIREMQMLSRFPQKNINIYVVRYIKNFFWENYFLPEFKLTWKIWEKYLWEKIYADLVLGFRMPENVTHRYPCDMRNICIDKSLLENIFPQYTIPSILCTSYDDIKNNFTKISTQKKVLKPISQSGGRGIIISEQIPDISQLKNQDFPYLLQGFHDTSWGFYGLCKSTHDFRVVILDGEIIGKILRTPQENSLICNTGSWWKLQDIWNFTIPKNIIKIIKDIDAYCSRYSHRYYSIDMWLGINWEIKVYELNSAAALSSQYIAHKLWDYIVKNILKVS